MRLEIGEIVGGYEITGILGAGGMGSVYKARNTLSGRIDAIKVLLPDMRDSPDLAGRFLNEIKVLASLSHPHIAALHTALRIDNQLLMVMEFVEGQSLEERLNAGPMPVAESIACISQVLSALSYAHERGVVHRDIKPANIAVKPGGDVKLLDFGIARAASGQHLTITGMVLGSLYYMSPEQVNGQPADARSDLYSVGVTLYRMVTGRRPFDGASEFELMRAQVSDTPLPPIGWNPAIPAELSDAIMRALAKSPAQRFQTADEFRNALEACTRHSGEPAAYAAAPPLAEPGSYAIREDTPLPSSTNFHADLLSKLRNILAPAMGPIASTLVRKYSRSASSLPDLCLALAGEIPADADRRAFLKACRSELGADSSFALGGGITQTTPVPPQSSAIVWDPLLLERSRKDLAGYIGPLARVIIERASKRARSVEELYSLISAEIPSEKDRAKFLASR